jgi:hypothetical protein
MSEKTSTRGMAESMGTVTVRLGRLLTAFLFFSLYSSQCQALPDSDRTPNGWLAFWVGGTWAAGSTHRRRKGTAEHIEDTEASRRW